MTQAPRGHYKTILRDSLPHVRIAFTHTPIIGCTRIPKEPVIAELKKSDDEYKDYYVNGLENGTMVAIVENGIGKEHWGVGELYFRT